MEGFADSGWAILILATTSFTESIFFPIPPDVLLIPISLQQPKAALGLAALVTISSVAGAVVGHWLGQRFGRPLLYRLVSESKVERVERLFQRYGAWAILVAAFTPIPYKVFAISAGMLDMDRRSFILASMVGRGARFFILGGLIFAFGENIQSFLDDKFEMITVVAAVGLVIALGIMAVIIRRRHAKNAAGWEARPRERTQRYSNRSRTGGPRSRQ